MEVIKNKKILALVGIVALIMSTFLPYVTIKVWGYSDSLSLWGYIEGKLILVLTLANALFIFKDWIEKYIPALFNNGIGRLVEKANNPKFSLIPTILAAALAIYLFTSLDVDSEYLSYGLGFYLLWIGVIALVGHAIFYKGDKQTVQPTYTQSYEQQPMNQTYTQQPMNQNYTQQPTMMDNDKKYCPHCRSQVNADATACFMCGNKF